MDPAHDLGQGIDRRSSISPSGASSMSEFDRFSYDAGRPRATPDDAADSRGWHRARHLFGAAPAAKSRGKSPTSHGVRRRVAIAIASLIALAIIVVIAGQVTRPSGGAKAEGAGPLAGFGTAHATLAKPPAGKPLIPQAQTPPPVAPPVVTAPTVSPSKPTAPVPSQPASPLGASPLPQIASAMPPTPVVSANAPYAPIVYPARHDKHFGDSCPGQLTLSSTGLTFNCPDYSDGNVQVAINQIAAVDENGIRLTSGKKYHFSIQGMTKSGEQQMFTDWLNRVH